MIVFKSGVYVKLRLLEVNFEYYRLLSKRLIQLIFLSALNKKKVKLLHHLIVVLWSISNLSLISQNCTNVVDSFIVFSEHSNRCGHHVSGWSRLFLQSGSHLHGLAVIGSRCLGGVFCGRRSRSQDVSAK